MENKKLHVLHLPSWYLPEGGQFCRNQVQALNEAGINTRILANVTISTRKYGIKGALKFPKGYFLSHEDDIDVFRHFHISLPLLKKIDSFYWVKQTVRMVDNYIGTYGKPDVIHVHSVLWGGYVAKLIKDKYKIAYVITEHKGIFGLSCEWAKAQFMEWQNPYMKEAFSNADLIIPVSENLIPKISTYLNRPVPIKVISNMIDTDFFHYKPRMKKNDTIKAIMVNGLYHTKAYDILFPAADKALDKLINLEINIIGEEFSGKYFEELWSKVRNKSRINFAGEKDSYDVRKALWEADFFIISSRVESQSVSTLEALATGLPVVCTGVIPKMIANDSNSIRVPVENVEKLTDAIISMAASYQVYDKKQIASDLQKKADKRVVANELIQAYHSVKVEK